MFSDKELAKLRSVARKERVPLATAAYRLIEKNLKKK
jgi:hypothetical protein